MKFSSNNDDLYLSETKNHYKNGLSNSLIAFNFLVCMLALLAGILIGEKYRKWKKGREEKKDTSKGAEIKRTDGSGSAKKDSDTEPPV